MKTKLQLISTFICFLIVSGSMPLSAQCWQQVGQELEGEDEYDFAGASIGLSDDGNTIVYGAEQNNFNRGKTKVFKWNGTTWIQKGSSIIGETMGERSGTSVSISNDGSILAIGATGNDQVIQNAGVVRVFEWANNDWVQKGNSIYGLSTGELIGDAISLSDDGNTLAIGAPFKLFEDGTNSTLGLVRVYHWEDSNWVQIGTDLTGQSEGDWYGNSVSLNGNGDYLAVGAEFSEMNGSESGYAKVYHWNATEWVQLGDDFIGENAESLGSSIELTSDAQSVVIGAPLNSDNGTLKGKIRVFDLVNGNWVQRGNALVGESMITRFGESVSISTDGTIIAAGGLQNSGNGQNSGHVRAYYWDGNAWSQIGEDINGEASDDFFGSAVALSGNGSILAASAPSNDGPATNSGQIRIFQSCEFLSLSEQETTNFNVFPNPSSEFITIDFGKQLTSGKISVTNALGQLIDERFISEQQMVHFSLPLHAGSYFITITTPEFGAVTQKVVKL